MSWIFFRPTDSKVIETVLRAAPLRRLYELGDLEEPHWPRTTWFAAERSMHIDALFMLYDAEPMPVLLAMDGNQEASGWLLKNVDEHITRRTYVHAEALLLRDFQELFPITAPVLYARMGLGKPACLESIAVPSGVETRSLTVNDLRELRTFYKAANEGHWFTDEMLSHGSYFGAYRNGVLKAVAGTHILSRSVGVAALGNIATLPENRSEGLATAVTGALCQSLVPLIRTIGLNVRADNLAARRCYEKLGFEDISTFYEFYIER